MPALIKRKVNKCLVFLGVKSNETWVVTSWVTVHKNIELIK